MDNKGLAFEQLVKAILALLILLAVIGVFYVLFKPAISGIAGIQNDTDKQGTSVIDDLNSALGKDCEDRETKCNAITHTLRECENGRWVIPDEETTC